MFPGDLLQHTYADPSNPGRLCGRSEVARRGKYFDHLEDVPLSGRLRRVLVQLIQNCLDNDPTQRPTAEQLVSGLEEMKADVEGSYGELAKVDAVRQVMTVKAIQQHKKENDDEMTTKDEEIQQLRQQLQVRYVTRSVYVHHQCFIILVHSQASDERHEAELNQKDVEIQQKNVRNCLSTSDIILLLFSVLTSSHG